VFVCLFVACDLPELRPASILRCAVICSIEPAYCLCCSVFLSLQSSGYRRVLLVSSAMRLYNEEISCFWLRARSLM